MRYRLLIVIMLMCGGAYAQANKMTLKGTLVMATGEEFPYRIEITETNNVVTGYGYTYDEKDEAKAMIKGKVDKPNRKLTFKETEIVSSHSVFTKAFMCLLQASLDYRGNKLTGPATNKQLDNTSCTEGKITFSNAAEIDQLFSSHDPYDVEIRMGEKKKDPETPAPAAAVAPKPEVPATADKITAGIEKSYEWKTDSIIVDIWDGSNYDGDVVSILFDGKPVLDKYVIQRQKKRISIPLPATGLHTITIVADDEGTDPPNTATLRLYDGETRYNVVAYNKKNERSIIKVKRLK